MPPYKEEEGSENSSNMLQGDQDLRTEINLRYAKCVTHYSEWKVEAEEDYRFVLGDQWTEEEKAVFKTELRPCLVFNRIRSLTNIISGYQRENVARIRVVPEGGEDRIFSEVMDKALMHIDKQSKLGFKLSYLFDSGIYCGKDHIEGYKDYTDDPVRGSLKWKINGPYKVMVDPDCYEYDINEGAEYLFVTDKYSKSKLKSMYPDKKDVIDNLTVDGDQYADEGGDIQKEGDADNYGNNPTPSTVVMTTSPDLNDLPQDVKFTHKEYWRKKYVKKFFVVDRESGEPVKFNDEDEAKTFISEMVEKDPETWSGEIKIIDRELPEMWVASMVCGHVLRDVVSPFEPEYSGFPEFRFMADWAPSAPNEKLKVQGIVRSLKDPQREKNKAKSQFLHVISTQSNSGWIGDDDALTDDGWRDLKKMGSTPGLTVRKKKNSDLREIQPQAPAMTEVIRESKADEEFLKISNINPDLLGMQEKTVSGRAIALRVRQAVISFVRIFVNYRYTKEILGKFMLKVIPDIMDEKKLGKILGEKYRQSVDKNLYPEGLTDGVLKAFLQMVKDSKYDVEVTEADQSKTMRAEVFDQLIELAKTGAGQDIPLDLIMEYMDLPNLDEIKTKIKETRAQRLEEMQATQGQK